MVVVVKGYPRLSETFIAQELLGLERAGLELIIASLRLPTDKRVHKVNREIQAPVNYLPEYLHHSPWRVMRALLFCLSVTGFRISLRALFSDLRRDFTRNRFRRFGQAVVLAAEWPEDAQWLHAHFIHTPASVARYTSLLMNIPWTVSAHAKDIWTSPSWELASKLSSARWSVTCTKVGHEHLSALAADSASVHLSYHGLDLDRFPAFTRTAICRNGLVREDPFILLSVGRAVEKKGYDIVLQALAKLPEHLNWRFIHIGDGPELPKLKSQAQKLGISHAIDWLGAVDQQQVLENYRRSDAFVLACRITDDGDRDGLPNVLVEAASQGLACVTTSVSGIPEFFINNQNGLLVASEDSRSLADALNSVIVSPELRKRLGQAAERKVRTEFDCRESVDTLLRLFKQQWNGAS